MKFKEIIMNNLSDLCKMKIFVLKHNIKSVLKWKLKKFDGFLQGKPKEVEDRYLTNEYRISNDFYGIANSLKKYTNRKKPLHIFLEHGVYFGEHVNMEEIGGIMPAVVTFSNNRKKYIKLKSDIPVICIGPYINYVESFYSDTEMKKMKNKFGKILLVFPQHTIEGVSLEENQQEFIRKVKKVKEEGKYNSVFISLYYREANEKYIELYSKNGFIPICAGNRSDPDFLPRLKSFILMADATASNNVGTHIGYCHVLKKKHIYLEENSKIKANNKDNIKNVPELYLNSAIIEKNEVKETLKSSNEKKINEVIEKYWGTNYFYTKEELRIVFETFDKVFKKSKNEKISYNQAFKIILDKNLEIKELFERKDIV